jgi:GGDEF domain-containing protein
LLGFGLVDCIPTNAQIQRLSEVGQDLTRREDLLARLGAQGMALLLMDAELSTGQRIAARMKEKLAAELGSRLRTVVQVWEGGSVSSFLVRAKAQLIEKSG